MNTTTILNKKICFALSIFLFSLVADATGKTNESISHNATEYQVLFTGNVDSDSIKNKVIVVDGKADTEAPVFTVIPRNGIANSLEEVAFEFVMAVDNVSAVTITSSDVVDGNVNSGILTRTWTATDKSGNSSTASASVRYYGNDKNSQEENQLTQEIKIEEGDLGQNFPNPFSTKTIIPFHLPTADFVTLKIYDASGRSIFTDSNDFEKGDNEFEIKGSDLEESGVLYYELITSKSKYAKKMAFNPNE